MCIDKAIDLAKKLLKNTDAKHVVYGFQPYENNSAEIYFKPMPFTDEEFDVIVRLNDSVLIFTLHKESVLSPN